MSKNISVHLTFNEEKCKNCTEFCATVDTIDITRFSDKERKYYCDVYCINRDECENIENYLRRKMQK